MYYASIQEGGNALDFSHAGNIFGLILDMFGWGKYRGKEGISPCLLICLGPREKRMEGFFDSSIPLYTFIFLVAKL